MDEYANATNYPENRINYITCLITTMGLNKSIFYTFLTQVPTQILGIISGIFITRILGPEGKGIYALFLADVQLFVLFFGLSANTAIVYFINNKAINSAKVTGIAVWLFFAGVLASGITMLFIVVLGVSKPVLGLGNELQNLIILLYFAIIISLLNSIFNGFLQAFKKFRAINQLSIFNSLLNLVFFGGIFLFDVINAKFNSIYIIVIITCIILLINGTFYVSIFVKNIGIKPNLQLSLKLDIKPFVKFMGTGHLSQLINFLNYRLDLWIMNYFIEPAQIGFYALAAGFANFVTLITLPIVNVITPTLIEKDKAERMILFKNFSQFNFTLVLGTSLLMFLIAPVILPFLYGKEFLPSVPLFRILLPGIVFASATKVLALISIATNQLKINLWATLFGLIFTVVFDFVLIPKYGAVGASITSLITYFTIFIVLYILLIQKSLLNRQNYFIISVKTIRDLIPYLYARKQ